MSTVITHDLRTQDRRGAVPFFCAYHLGLKQGRRMNERRRSGARWGAAYVDRYADHLMACVVGILFLSICDALFTLRILAHGGEELNWFMAVLIDDSVEKFITFKMALTSLALIMLIIHHNVRVFYRVRVGHINYAILSGYSVLIAYELYLLDLASRL
ncbi:MAG: DUF5658 family protein [Nitrosomonas sp.]|nr:DUF5658 family protein [Nitrosomonas sp.]